MHPRHFCALNPSIIGRNNTLFSIESLPPRAAVQNTTIFFHLIFSTSVISWLSSFVDFAIFFKNRYGTSDRFSVSAVDQSVTASTKKTI
jgi:hypothetical protein